MGSNINVLAAKHLNSETALDKCGHTAHYKSKSLTTSSAVVLGNSSSVVVHTAANLSSHQQDVTLAITPSTLIGNDTLPLTLPVAFTTSSGLFISSTSHVVAMSSEQSSSTVAVNGSTSSRRVVLPPELVSRLPSALQEINRRLTGQNMMWWTMHLLQQTQ